MNYLELSTAIQDYCQNSELTFVDHINDFIIAAEDKVFMSIQMPAFWGSEDKATVEDKFEYTLQAGVIDVTSVRVNQTEDSTGNVINGPVFYLYRKDYDFLLEAYPGTTGAASTGIPKYYAVSSAAASEANPTLTIRLGPIPDAIYAMTVDYYGKTAAQSITGGDSTAETWLSVTAPDVLLYGSLVQAYTYMKGEQDIIQLYDKQFLEGLGLLKNMGEARQPSDLYREGQKRTAAG
ncbi:MAG: hypothetical protein CL489_16695 [Acidobacteria bacterium]|nr:hypothetical protein [Acidobacteriota bacterium]